MQADHAIARGGFGLVPEGRQIFPSLSVRENLETFARPLTTRAAGTGMDSRKGAGAFPASG